MSWVCVVSSRTINSMIQHGVFSLTRTPKSLISGLNSGFSWGGNVVEGDWGSRGAGE